jgi:hypothetical protein
MPRSKAQALERLRQELQKCQARSQALSRELQDKKPVRPSLWALMSWINERDRRNEASRQKAIARAIAQVSLDPCTWKK